MSRRRRLSLLACLAALVAAALLAFHWQPRSDINPDNFARITPGMSEAEVVALLGPPPDVSPRHAGYVRFGAFKRFPGFTTEWFTPSYAILIFWDDQRFVRQKEADIPSLAADPTLDRIRRFRSWLGL